MSRWQTGAVPVLPPSATLSANERIRARIAEGRPVLHLAFGEAGLPAPPILVDALAAAARLNSYPPVAGTARLREGIAGYFARRRLPSDPKLVMAAPGSKPLLYALMLALPGDLVLPAPSWVSYAAQARLAGKAVTRVPIPEESGGVPDPDLLEDALAAARSRGESPGVLMLTLPDNPTGSVPSRELLGRVCAVARSEGLTVISDEVYRDLAYEPDAFVSPAELYPEGTIVTAGLSKNLSLGGWRTGFARVPQNELGEDLLASLSSIASEVWSGVAAPVQEAASLAVEEPPEITAFIAKGRRLHAAVARAVYAEVIAAGAHCREPQGAFYLYPELASELGGAALAERLLDRFEIAVLPGEAFGDEPAKPRFRLSTSLLYGSDDDRRLQAMEAGDPTSLPWIAEALERIRTALRGL